MRINKYFTEHGIASRREADRWIADGRVAINGQVAKLGDQVQDGDEVRLDGHPVARAEKKPVVIAYHKPVGIECTSDPRVPNNIIRAVNYPERLVHIGRLDVQSEGLILLTNLGGIVNPILRRKYGHEKEYVVEYDAEVTPTVLEVFRRGVDIGDANPTLPCRATQSGKRRVHLVLTEGRNRQIRRMAEAVGLRVTRLKRIRIMHIELGELRKDTWRPLTPTEFATLQRDLAEQEKRFGPPIAHAGAESADPADDAD